ncbi:MAG: M60 family metallopeptidase, partial [Alistipes sp.]|nr:M60 family metallopeptidase [Alistipes sp.]
DSVANVEAVEGDELVAVSSITSSCKGSYGDTIPENLIDGDMESYYSAAGTIHDMPVSLTCYFTDVDRIDYVDVTPGRVYGKWKETDVYVTTEESQTEYLYGEYDFKESGDVQRVTFQDGLIKPKSVRFEIKDAGMWIAGDGVTSPTLIAAHEITFFAKNSDALSMLEIFTDESFSELKEGVTEEQIDAIENEFFRNLASDIYAGTYDLKYRAATYKPYPHPDVDMKRFRTSNYSLNDNVTGLYFEAGEHAVFVEETYGLPISLRVIDYQPDTTLPDKSSGWCNEDGHYYPLIKGQNKLNIKRRGLIYVMYHTEDPVAKPIKINFPTALINGYYDLADKSPEKVDWGTILDEAKADHIDMVGEKSIFTLPVQWIKLYCNTDEKAKAVIEQADSIIFLQEQIQGHHLYNTGGHRNRMLFSSTKADAFMFAGAYRTGYSLNYGKTIEDRSRAIGTPMTGNPLYLDGTINMLLNPKKFRVDGWGAYHEVGHVNQLPGFKWNGLAEVTNNFTAMYCAHFFIGDDYPLHKSDYMLLMSGDWYDEKGKNHHTSNRYDAAWQCYNNGRIKAKANDSAGDNEIDETKIPHPFGAYVGGHPDIKQRGIDPFFKIVPFWQLFLYNTLVMGREDFYPNVYHECRTGNLPDGSPNVALTPAEEKENDGYNNDGERQLNFIRLCCDAAQEDLTEFFYNWGFLTPFDGIIEDYGEHKFRVTQEMIDEVYEYAKKYPKPAKENIWFINNHNLDLYRNGNGKNVKGFNIDKHIDDECDGSNIHLYNGMSEYGG